jgi:hypothetical protein
MSDNDLIRRGDALQAAKGFIGAETAIAAIPALTPPDDVAKVVEEAGRVANRLDGYETYDRPKPGFMSNAADTIRALTGIITAQAARIAGLQRTYDDLYSDALADAKSDAQEFDSDLWAMVRAYLDDLHFDWRDFMEDGVTADEAMSHIRECMDEETRRAEAAETALAAERAKTARLAEVERAARKLEENLGVKGVNVGSLRVDLYRALAALSEAEAPPK